MRIALLTASPGLGGAERATLEMVAALREHRPGWDLAVIAPAPGPLLEAAISLGAEGLVAPWPQRLSTIGEYGMGAAATLRASVRNASGVLGACRALRRQMAGWRPDIVHSQGLKTHLLGAWARPRDARLIWHLHDYVSTRRLTASLLRAHRRRCRDLVAVSRSVAADAAMALRWRRQVPVIHNAVDLTRYAPGLHRADLDALAGLSPSPGDVIRIGLVATSARWKGHDVFLRALAGLPASVPFRGYLVGGPQYATHGSQYSLEQLREMAKSLNLGDRIAFTGFVTDTAPVMRALDIVVHASTAPEPFGLVIAEGMACGRAIVVSATGGAAEIVASGEDALTFAPSDVDGLIAQLTRLATDASLRERLGARALQTARTGFSRQRLAGDLAALYESRG